MKLIEHLIADDKLHEAALMEEGRREAELLEDYNEAVELARGTSNVKLEGRHLTALYREGERLQRERGK